MAAEKNFENRVKRYLQSVGIVVHLQHDVVSRCKHAGRSQNLQNTEGFLLHRPDVGGKTPECITILEVHRIAP